MQHGGYRRIQANGDKPPPRPERPARLRDHGQDFHRTLSQLRSALWAENRKRVTELERRIDHIVARWERDS